MKFIFYIIKIQSFKSYLQSLVRRAWEQIFQLSWGLQNRTVFNLTGSIVVVGFKGILCSHRCSLMAQSLPQRPAGYLENSTSHSWASEKARTSSTWSPEVLFLWTSISSENVKILSVLQDLLDVVECAVAVVHAWAQQVQGRQTRRQQICRHRHNVVSRRKTWDGLKRERDISSGQSQLSRLWLVLLSRRSCCRRGEKIHRRQVERRRSDLTRLVDGSGRTGHDDEVGRRRRRNFDFCRFRRLLFHRRDRRRGRRRRRRWWRHLIRQGGVNLEQVNGILCFYLQ